MKTGRFNREQYIISEGALAGRPKMLHPSTCSYVTSETVALFYDKVFEGQPLFEFDQQKLAEWFAQPGKVIDLGCGTGRNVLQFAQRGFEVTGVDLSPYMLAIAKRKLTARELTATLLQADFTACHPQLIEHSYDVALCMFSTLGLVFGHEGRVQALRRFRQLLKPDGQLALHVHSYGYNLWRLEGQSFLIKNAWQSLRGRQQWGDKYLPRYRGINNMYLHVFRAGEIKRLLAEAGFEITDFIALNPWRSRPLKWSWLAGILANGYLIRAKVAEPDTGAISTNSKK